MRRDNEIRFASLEYSEETDLKLAPIDLAEEGFMAGAQWADAHPRWISVEDALPDRHKTIFSEPVIVTDGVIVGIDFYNHQEGEWESFRNPTHWMFLPDVPEKGGEK